MQFPVLPHTTESRVVNNRKSKFPSFIYFYLPKHQVVVACTGHTDTDADQTALPCQHKQMHQRGWPVEKKRTWKVHKTLFQTSGQVNHSRDTAGCCIPFSIHTSTVQPKRKSKWNNLLRQNDLSSDRIEFVGVTNLRQMQMCRLMMKRRNRERETEKAGAHVVGFFCFGFASVQKNLNWATQNSVNGNWESIVSIAYAKYIFWPDI